MERKQMPVGVNNFKDVIDGGYYYVDKTLAIKKIIDNGAKTTLFTRPKRFGKTMFLSMLQTFFEDEKILLEDNSIKKIDNSRYFEGLKIMDEEEKYLQHQGKHPVIFLSFDFQEQPDYDSLYNVIVKEIQREFRRHRYVVNSPIIEEYDLKKYKNYSFGENPDIYYGCSIKFLSELIYISTGKRAIILIDEYDKPLKNAYDKGFYKEMLDFLLSLYDIALQGNEYDNFGILTGCLRTKDYGYFTRFDNLYHATIFTGRYFDHCGFLQSEIDEILDFYNLHNKADEIKCWYGGYFFGDFEVYNPYSVSHYINNCIANDMSPARIYWEKSISDNIICEIIKYNNLSVIYDIEILMSDKTIVARQDSFITYTEISFTDDTLWNYLLYTGYLKFTSIVREDMDIEMTLCIPNEEIKQIYIKSAMHLFLQKVKTLDLSEFVNAMENANTGSMSEIVQDELFDAVRYINSEKSFHHDFLVGLLNAQNDYNVISNRESGEGRYDLVLKNWEDFDKAYIFELKEVDSFEKMEKVAEEALLQIDEKKYEHNLKSEGYKIANSFAVVFCKKRCLFKAK